MSQFGVNFASDAFKLHSKYFFFIFVVYFCLLSSYNIYIQTVDELSMVTKYAHIIAVVHREARAKLNESTIRRREGRIFFASSVFIPQNTV